MFLIVSFPGKHDPNAIGSHMGTVGSLLETNVSRPIDADSWPIIAQISSIGYLKVKDEWLTSIFQKNLSRDKEGASDKTLLRIIFPTKENVDEGIFGAAGGNCLSFAEFNNEIDNWLQNNYLW